MHVKFVNPLSRVSGRLICCILNLTFHFLPEQTIATAQSKYCRRQSVYLFYEACFVRKTIVEVNGFVSSFDVAFLKRATEVTKLHRL